MSDDKSVTISKREAEELAAIIRAAEHVLKSAPIMLSSVGSRMVPVSATALAELNLALEANRGPAGASRD